MTGLGQRFETIIAVCSSVVPFICGIHNNAIILLTAFVSKEILWLLFFSWGSWEGIWWCRESWAEAELGLNSPDSFFVVLGAWTHQLVRPPWLLTPGNVSVCRAFGSSVIPLHLEKDDQSPQNGKPAARLSTSPQRHRTVLFEVETGKNWATQDLKDLVSIHLHRGVLIVIWMVVWSQQISSGKSRVHLNKVLPDWKFSNHWNWDEVLPLQWTGRAWSAHKIFCLATMCLTRKEQKALFGGAGDWDTLD